MSERPIISLFYLLCMWAKRQGAQEIAKQPGCWEGQLDGFEISINASMEERQNSKGAMVPPVSIVIVQPDYIAAIMVLGPYDGLGPAGMEADVTAALAKAGVTEEAVADD